MAEPKCPDCGVGGMAHIISEVSDLKSKGGDAWFEVAFCDQCGHVYGVFAKHVLSHEMHIPVPRINIPGL